MCQGHNIDFAQSSLAEYPTQKVNCVFLDVQLPAKKAQRASTKHTAYRRDPAVWVGEIEGTTRLLQKRDVDK